MKTKVITICLAVFVLFSGYFFLRMKHFKKVSIENYENSLRWKDNYIASKKEFYKIKLKNDKEVYKLNQEVFTANELLYSKTLELSKLRNKLKDNEIKESELNSYINMQGDIITTLSGLLDSTCVTLEDANTKLELYINGDSIQANITSKIDIDIFVKDTYKLYKVEEDRNKIGRWWVNTKLGYWLSKKYISPEVQVDFNNPNIEVKNINYIKIEK